MCPPCPIIVITTSNPNEKYCEIIRSVYPFYIPSLQGLTTQVLVEKVVEYVREKEIVCRGTKVVFTSALHEELSGTSTFRILDVPSAQFSNNLQHI